MKSRDLVRLVILDSPQGRIIKTKGFKSLGQKEILMKCSDTNIGAKVMMKLVGLVLEKHVVLGQNHPITGVTKSPLYARLDYFEGEECFVLSDH